jgi:hypothetical protein
MALDIWTILANDPSGATNYLVAKNIFYVFSQTMDSRIKTKGSARKPRIQNIVAAAEALDVNRNHLRLVLNGQRKSRSLLARYEALKATSSIERIKPTSAAR